MTYPDAQSLSQTYSTNHWLIKRLTDGLSHADSLLQPPFQGNCLNWVLGHIVAGRQEALRLLGVEPVWDEESIGRYKTGSTPITHAEQAQNWNELISDLDRSQERIAASLAEISPERLGEVVETSRGSKPVAQHLDGLGWHETYHTGQLELLRELANTTKSD